MSKETDQNSFRCAGIPLESQADAVEYTDDPFKSLQSDLDNLNSLDHTLVPDCTIAEDFTASVDDYEILKYYRESQRIALTSDNDDEESSEEPGSLQKPDLCSLELLQNCCFFEEEW